MSAMTPFRWPLAFLLLNLIAIAVWFQCTGVFEPGTASPQSFSPNGSGLDADGIEHVDIVFDTPLDPATVGPGTVRLHPPAAGATELADARTLRYRLGEKLRPATAYRLSWSDTLRGRKGQAVGKEFYSFATARPALTAAEAAGFDRESYTVRLSFNQPVRAEALASVLSSRFSGDDAFRRGDRRARVVSTGAAASHRVRIDAGGTGWLVLRVAAGMTATEGNLGLEKDVDLVWRVGEGEAGDAPEWARGGTPRALKPKLTFLGMEAGWEDGGGIVTIHASSPLDSAAAAKYVAVDPDVNFSCVPSRGGLKLAGDFEPGRQYRVTLRPGIPAGAAGETQAAYARNVWFDDRPRSLDFSFGGGYLLPGGMLSVPVTSVNVDAFTLRLRRLYPDNLVETALDGSDFPVGEDRAGKLRETTIRPANRRNETVETLVDLRSLVAETADNPAGVYGLEIVSPAEPWRRRRATVVVSDIGLGARLGRNQLFAWTMGLGSGAPLPGAGIAVYSNRRRRLADGTTGDDGTVDMAIPPLPEGERPMLVVASAGGDTTFVHLDNHQNARGAALAGGAAYPDAYQAFVATDRGVYRGGETLRASLLVRDRRMRGVPVMPVETALLSADGKVRHRAVRTTDSGGRIAVDIPLAADLPAGAYRVRAALPGHAEELGRAVLQIADYIPETLSLSLALSDNADMDQPSRLSLRASRLAGGETGRLRGTVLAEYSPAPFRHDDWKDWTFGDARVEGSAGKTVERTIMTDAGGGAAAEWDNPPVDTPAAVALSVRAEVLEPGGRALGETVRAVLHQAPFYLGVKPESAGMRAGGDASFLLAAVAPGGKRVLPPSGWKTRLYSVRYSSLLRRREDGRLIHDWQRLDVPEAEATGSWGGGRARVTFPSLKGGSYRLVAESGDGKSAAFDFTVRGGGAGWVGSDPETLSLEPSKPLHPVGSTAEVLVKAPFAGRAVVTVESDRVLRHWVRELKEGDNTLAIPVEEDMRPNAYVAVSLVRPVGAEKTWRPHRAVGAVSLDVDNADRRLAVVLDAPEAVAPGAELPVTVRVARPDGTKAAGAAVVLWGVDEGVLGLTGYRTPSPWEHFHRKRRLAVLDADMYSRLAPELSSWRQGRDPLPGGDGASSEAARRLNPVAADRVRAAVIHRSDLVTDADGVATVTLPVPEIASKMRLMAWAGLDEKTGAGEREAEVKAPVSFLASWPRFAAPGDTFTVAVTLLNRSGKEAEITLSADAESGLELTPAVQKATLPDGGAGQVSLRARALGAGTARASLRASLGGDSFRQAAELAVRPPVLFRRLSGVEEIAPGETARFIPAGDLLRANGRFTLTAGGSPQIKLAGALEYLIGYPYACGEQTASRLAALIALPDLLALSRPGGLGPEEAAALARSCMDRLEALQASNGGIRMWPGDENPVFWLSAQTLYLLEECRERGVAVPESLRERCQEYLSDRLDIQAGLLTKGDAPPAGGEAASLACLALARGNALRRSWLVRMVEIAAERSAAGRPLVPQALAFLCHATLLAGDPGRARELFDEHSPGIGAPTPDFARAAWLAAGMRLDVSRAVLADFAAGLERALPHSFRYWNTRDTVWVLLSLGAYRQRFRPAPESRARVMVNGEERAFALTRGTHWTGLFPGAVIEALAEGSDPLHLVWTAEGIPADGRAAEEDAGMTARRRVFRDDGGELRAPFVLRQGDVCRVRIELAGEADDLVVADLLPAGLEVENPRLKGRDGEEAAAITVAQVERRDDRLLLFGAVRGEGQYEYLCRAVTPGEYVWPALDAGRMYDPGVRSVHGEGRLVVLPGTEAEDE